VIETVTIRDESVERVQTEWSGLHESCAERIPFVTPEWQSVWLRHFQADRRLAVLSVREGERLLGVMPLLIEGARAEFVGHYSICDYLDVVIAPGFESQCLSSLLDHLSTGGITDIELRGLREDSPTLPALLECASGAGFAATSELEAISPRLHLPDSWEDYLGRLSKKDRHELRRKLRRLEAAGGDLELRIITSAAEAEPLLPQLFHLMRVSNHHKEEFLDRPGMQAFFADMVATMADAGMLRFHVLTMDRSPVAMVLNLDVGGTLYMYNSGYDPAYAQYAVGLMSKALLIRDAIESGRRCVDFMRGDESYKYNLGGKDRQVHRVVLTKA
jgi:CelD/BcsL family acetyltransferase involved in cellulose biosynthesis